MNWHNIHTEEIFRITGSSPQGLSAQAVEQKQLEYGPNRLEQKKKKPVWKMFVSQFTDFMILVLIGAAIISGIIGEFADTLIILIIVILNAILGFVQEYRAEKAMEALKKMAALNATVLRENRISTVESEELVPGDVVLLESGNIIPADIRLFESYGVKTDESSLTGESVPADKVSDTLPEKDLPLGDRFNMAYKATLMKAGRAKGIVVATGINTEIGHIARLLEEKDLATPLQVRMTDFGKKLSYIILFICALLFGIGILRGENSMDMLLLSISLAVAAIPEALPALITIALALGAKRMVRVNALIRKLHAVETLGSVTFICSDKTGTLTRNKMQVAKVDMNNEVKERPSNLSLFELCMAISHDVKPNETGEWQGDPTEIALVEFFTDKNNGCPIPELLEKYKRVGELPFDSDRRCMTTVHRIDHRYLVISKGAVESIAEKLIGCYGKESVISQAEEMAKRGMRVIAYGFRQLDDLPHPFNYESVERELEYLGMAGMIDPPRPEARVAIEECKAAGIQTVMITGDHPATAAAIAEELGILSPGRLVITGKQLQEMTAERLDEMVENIRVYARVSPEQKLNIVKSLQRKNHFVAMTGDGVNDAPSLKSANIGVAMGLNGSDVSKEAAHMILLDDNFSSIVRAVREGRRIYDNIRKFVKYIMACNSAEIATIFLAPLLGLPMPLLPIHILWINLVTDGLPGLALAREKAEKNIMSRPPRKTDESIFAGGIGFHIIWVGLLMAGITIASQAWAYHNGIGHWQSIVFTVLTFSQIGHVLAIRSERDSLFRQGIFSNLSLIGAVLLTIGIHLLILYVPLANRFFNTYPLSPLELLGCVGVSSIVILAVELEKWIRRKNADVNR